MTADLSGQTLDGRYQIEGHIGRGGMGDVYLARHLMLGSRVAVKVLAGDRARDATAARRFVREAKSAFRVDHSHCVRVTDLGAADGLLYIVMEYLDGRTIGEELGVDGPIAAGRAAHIGSQVAAALAHAHSLGLVHRDLKPDNIMLLSRDGDSDFVKVLDFGLARVFDDHGDLAGTAVSLSPLTQKGLVFGTPEYMSPEQATGGEVQPASDLYSLGAVLYHMLTGAVPFSGATFTEILSRQVRDRPVSPAARRPDLGIPAELDRLVMDCLEKAPVARPASARDLGARLVHIADQVGRGWSRLTPALAASETMDLESSRVARAAMPTRDAEPAETGPPVSQMVTAVGPDVARRSRAPLVAVALAVMTASAVVVYAVARERSGEQPAVAAAEPLADAVPAPAAVPDPVPVPASPPDPVHKVSDPGTAPERPSSTSALKGRIEKHLRAAEAARKSGNLLRQLAEADQARQLDPKNRRAAVLMGEALVKSGDKDRGCPLLRRSALFREVGCAD